MNKIEQQEKIYLKEVRKKLECAYKKVHMQIINTASDVSNVKKYIWENIAELDFAEKAANRIAVTEAIEFGEKAKKERERLLKSKKSPYFGRIDFKCRQEEDNKDGTKYYIGIHSFSENQYAEPLIYDWRAPVSSMFYDFELGQAFYEAPIGRIDGEIIRKRQYRIKDGKLEYMLESSLNIGDEVLQKELSQSTDEKMKNIVATIQREQNIIIRDEDTNIMIIQGVAGSGKSSIAMHRVAFLLYRFKEEITSDDIMIISPNKVFADYISGVLPELGEENIPEMEFEELAGEILGDKIVFQTFAEQVEEILQGNDPDNVKRIKEKSEIAFLEKLDKYLNILETEFFQGKDLECSGYIVKKDEIESRFAGSKSVPILKRIDKLINDLIYKIKSMIREEEGIWKASFGTSIRRQIEEMFPFKNSLQIYQNFFQYIELEHLYKKKKKLEYCDVFPLIYVMLHVEGMEMKYGYVRHLLIDEMQDYTPVQYGVIKRLFQCKLTIMGDRYQNVNPHSSTSMEKISYIFPDGKCVELKRSYRSTYEIVEFSRKIQPWISVLPVERHGEKVSVTGFQTRKEEIEFLKKKVKEEKGREKVSIAILCKSQHQANDLYHLLGGVNTAIKLLGFSDKEFIEGIIITSIHMAKGLEFDEVIIPQVNKENYYTEMDRNLLYVACTRAMHKLKITYENDLSEFISDSFIDFI
ncbi:DNA helicase-2/ATP-dependent DNA helicase PcrA [Mobilisporobacter senegalensis]|uniref:DNA helicase-2/ATP-dependent DNA helicase PcrA n=1 Tax=Mobilisporobacter senegalensis TaxID=1329262 RepID=A0A3N1XKP4_9FIRM|nr:3'-5' exonuclease [Mobilisporobacter senegalensis]ROR27283.1 DNA helicase-2/ATP-dependent DNA helicase PcrA [Mobilisporobacter senegalensis]